MTTSDHDRIVVMEQCIPPNFREEWGEVKGVLVEVRDDIKGLNEIVSNGLRGEIRAAKEEVTELKTLGEANKARLGVILPVVAGLFSLAGGAVGVFVARFLGYL